MYCIFCEKPLKAGFEAETHMAFKHNRLSFKSSYYGGQMGYCSGCREHFEFRGLEVDHVVPRSKGGTDHRDNLQMLCSHCNRIKGDRPQEYLVARLKEMAVL